MTLDIPQITAAWVQLNLVAKDAITPIRDEAAYNRALSALDALLTEVGEHTDHPLADLLRGLIERVMAYQEQAEHVPPAAPDMELRLLIKERGVTQQQLAAATSIDQGQISKLSRGQRAFTADHIRRLSLFFQVSSDVFFGLA